MRAKIMRGTWALTWDTTVVHVYLTYTLREQQLNQLGGQDDHKLQQLQENSRTT
jgi:hypothetical protein